MNEQILKKLTPITKEEQAILDSQKTIDKSLYMASDSDEIDQKYLLENGKLIAFRKHTRFVYFPKHTHNYIEMVYMCQGQTKHRINGKEVILKAGEILILSQGASQEIFPSSEKDIAVNFIILPQFFDPALKMLGEEENLIRDFLIQCLQGKKDGTRYLHFKVSGILSIQNLIENMIWTLINESKTKRSISQWEMGLLFLYLVNHTKSTNIDMNNEEQKLMIQVLRYIEMNYKNANLTELAEKQHCNHSWLSREIKRQSGKTFTELVQKKRLQQAVYLLRTTNIKVGNISEYIGYENESYFYRLFKKEFGVSPYQYKRVK